MSCGGREGGPIRRPGGHGWLLPGGAIEQRPSGVRGPAVWGTAQDLQASLHPFLSDPALSSLDDTPHHRSAPAFAPPSWSSWKFPTERATAS